MAAWRKIIPASVKVLKQEFTWFVGEAARRPVKLERSQQGNGVGQPMCASLQELGGLYSDCTQRWEQREG